MDNFFLKTLLSIRLIELHLIAFTVPKFSFLMCPSWFSKLSWLCYSLGSQGHSVSHVLNFSQNLFKDGEKVSEKLAFSAESTLIYLLIIAMMNRYIKILSSFIWCHRKLLALQKVCFSAFQQSSGRLSIFSPRSIGW